MVEVIMAWIVFLFIPDSEEDEEMMSDEDDVPEVLISTYLSTCICQSCIRYWVSVSSTE